MSYGWKKREFKDFALKPRAKSLGVLQKRVSPTNPSRIEAPSMKDEYWQALKKLQKEKSPRCDGNTVDFWLDFLNVLASPCLS